MNKKRLFFSDEIHVPIILLDILKNIWLVILAVIVACISVFTYANMVHKPNYTSDVTFIISPRSNGAYVGFYSSLTTANEMATVFEEVFTSDVLQRMIKEDLNNPNLSFSINASVAKGTNILCLSVQADSPQKAHAIMQSVMKNYRQVSGYLFGGVVLDVLKKPQISLLPSNPFNLTNYMFKGAVIAAAFMIALVALLSIFRPTAKTIACAKRKMEESPLCVLRKEKTFHFLNNKQKRPVLITDTTTSFRYMESVLQLSNKVRHKMKKDNMKVLLVTSVAENEGKSTVSSNLALSLFKHGYKVAFIDMDLRKPSIHKIFKGYPQEDLFTCLRNGTLESLDEPDRLHIISREKASANPDKLLHSEDLVRLLNTLREKMDYIIFDTSPYTATADTGILLQHADCSLMVVRQDWASYNVCREVANEIADGDAEYLGYVINNYFDNGIEQSLNKRYENYGYYGKTQTEE